MGKFDAHKNFALSSVATAPSPATSGTSLVVTGGTGVNFPAVPFNAVIWPTGAKPSLSNAEVVRVTAIVTDTFTIVRAQESSSARTVIIGDQIMDASTAKVFMDIEALWGFRFTSATDLDETLPASVDLLFDDILEIGVTVSLELPATSTLEISAHIDQGDPQAKNKILSDTFMGANFSARVLSKNLTLDENKDFTIPEELEVGAGISLEIPVTSSLEVVAYALQSQLTPNPTGTLLMFAGPAAPAGYLLCQGQAVLRSAYLDLFNAIGTAFGAGDGSTTFNIPDFRGRSPIGSGTGTATGATAQTLGSQPTTGAGGEQTHQLSIAELAAHSHTYNFNNTVGNIAAGGVIGANSPALNTSTTGGDSPHNILSPVSVVNFIIKT